jgi:SH3 domain protein
MSGVDREDAPLGRDVRALALGSLWRRLLPSAVLVLASAVVQAETRYVTDQYDFNLRAGESTRYKILRTLQSGTPLEVLGVSKETGYARVRTEDGKIGFILTRYLQDEPAARSRLEQMQERLEELQQAPDKLAARLASLQQQHQALGGEYDALVRVKERLEQELAEVRHASKNAVRINEERQRLQDEVAELVTRVDDLERRNLELANQRDQRWFLIGAGVVAGGILIGLILPSIRLRRRRSSWGSL